MPNVMVDNVVITMTDEEFEVFNYTAPVTEGEIRSKRDNLLAKTDWCANSDVIMSDDMTTYRQALRDITEQEGFPLNITWPTKP